MNLPLNGMFVLEFCQYLAGPYAGLRLADLGARVVKIERPGLGDGCRQLAIKGLFTDGDSLTFHAINRNKQSCTANLKDPADLERVKRLIAKADVMTHNFRPGVMEAIGLDYETVREVNPRIIYAAVTGYGTKGPWSGRPGQDLLAQSLSGLTWLSGDAGQPPVPFGLAIADILAGEHLVQGILAALLQRGKTGQGATVEVSLLESILDFQFEVLTTYFNDGGQLPRRAACRNAHAYLAAPYGIYATRNGWIALAMGKIASLAAWIDCPALLPYASGNEESFTHRDEIKSILRDHLLTRDTAHWLQCLEPRGYWCSDVFRYAQLLDHDGYKALGMDQLVHRRNGTSIRTLRCPIRIDGEKIYSPIAAPELGNANELFEGEL
jgi:crotonobetainyl-CoA:carnitine CoA-transferase CaiB-like acyl-CoA transferase